MSLCNVGSDVYSFSLLQIMNGEVKECRSDKNLKDDCLYVQSHQRLVILGSGGDFKVDVIDDSDDNNVLFSSHSHLLRKGINVIYLNPHNIKLKDVSGLCSLEIRNLEDELIITTCDIKFSTKPLGIKRKPLEEEKESKKSKLSSSSSSELSELISKKEFTSKTELKESIINITRFIHEKQKEIVMATSRLEKLVNKYID